MAHIFSPIQSIVKFSTRANGESGQEFKPFFDLQYAGKTHYKAVVRPRGALAFKVQRPACLVEVICPQITGITVFTSNLSTSQRTRIIKDRRNKSLRTLAKEYDISYETVRRVLNK